MSIKETINNVHAIVKASIELGAEQENDRVIKVLEDCIGLGDLDGDSYFADAIELIRLERK